MIEKVILIWSRKAKTHTNLIQLKTVRGVEKRETGPVRYGYVLPPLLDEPKPFLW